MTWGVISLMEEIKARIEKAKTDNNLSFKAVYIGGIDHNRKENDYPLVIIRPDDIRLTPECTKNGITDDMRLNVIYVANEISNATNTLYKTSTESGVMYDLGVLLNYLEKKTSDGTVNVDLNGTSHDAPEPTVTFRYKNNLIYAAIPIRVKTSLYFRGTR